MGLALSSPLPIVAAPGTVIDLQAYLGQLFSGGQYSWYYLYNSDSGNDIMGWWPTGDHQNAYFKNGAGSAIAASDSFGGALTWAQLAGYKIVTGNDISPRLAVSAGGNSYEIRVIPFAYSDPTPGVINGADVAAAAIAYGQAYAGVYTPNGCHDLAMDFAAAVGAPLPWGSGDYVPPLDNVDGGLWRVVHRGDQNNDANWSARLLPGDIVRFDYADPGKSQHTFTVISTSGSLVRTVDNYGGVIADHSTDYQALANSATVTIYRIADTLNLIPGSAGDDILYGSIRGDRIQGGTGNDTLGGGAGNDFLEGGSGTDSMSGGAGNDTYIVGVSADVVSEAGGGGADLVKSSASYTLPNGVESLLLTGSNPVNGTGSNAANKLTGNNGANSLNGKAGNDALVGGGGADRFVFDTGLNSNANKDTILDFSRTEGDKIVLKSSLFHGLPPGSGIGNHLDVENAGAAKDGDDWIVYNKTTGALFYDSDGTGPAGRVQFAIVCQNSDTGTHPTLLYSSDFAVIA